MLWHDFEEETSSFSFTAVYSDINSCSSMGITHKNIDKYTVNAGVIQ